MMIITIEMDIDIVDVVVMVGGNVVVVIIGLRRLIDSSASSWY